MKIVVVSGGFDPIHSGHISYLKAAREIGDKLIVALNSDKWLINKKGKYFMPFKERLSILENLYFVDSVIDFDDDALGSAANALLKIKEMYPSDDIIFANGGDRNKDNCSEQEIEGVKFVFGVGGEDKQNSSSWILKDWQYYKESRWWGRFYNLFEETGVKVKELIVDPQKGMSFQRHSKRNEIWIVTKGECIVSFSDDNPDERKLTHLKKFSHFLAPLGLWHQIINPFQESCHLIEIQYGEICVEDDIERLEFYSSNSNI